MNAEKSDRSKTARTIVVKVGTHTLVGADGSIDNAYIKDFVGQLAARRALGERVVVVTSGAVRAGAEKLGLQPGRLDISAKQAAAAVGQGLLMERYTRCFDRHGIVTAQILLTRDVFTNRKKYLNARNTFMGLLERGAVPIVNENDTVAVEEIKFGDNDNLSAITAIIADADLLVILSDVSGLFDDDPKRNPAAELICEVRDIDSSIVSAARGTTSEGATGGMKTKIAAAKLAVGAGIRTVIAHGRTPNILNEILEGKCAGTTFLPRGDSFYGKKKWIAFGPVAKGRITVNDGARTMILNRGKSLLPVGVTAVSGRFDEGACVEIADASGEVFARGITNYSSSQVKKIMGERSSSIPSILGFIVSDDVVHRDNLALV